jgi:two-component system sensor histidine kinase GlrK
MMRFLYPRSFPRLLSVGFTLIALPLIFALIGSAVTVDQIANRSQQAVYRAVLATQTGRRLAELLIAMERSARQMVILDDRRLLETYDSNRKNLMATAREFSALPFDSEQMVALGDIMSGEQAIYTTLADPSASEPQLQKAVGGFCELTDHARTITARSNELIDREVEVMLTTAAQAQRIIFWQLLALIPVVVFLVIGFTIVITRPIRQIDHAIRRMGGGELGTPVNVSGPEDLQYLGERLDWMRRRLLDLEQQKNRFLRHVSHELKTPLTAVREGAELLSEEVVGKLLPRQREIAEILRHNSIELQKLIEDLLSYSASQFHKVTLELNPVQIRRVIDRVADDLSLAVRAKDLRVEITTDNVTLTADFEKLRIILDNLMSNAIKFSPPGGTISVVARVNGAYLELDVADQGPGIPHADRAHIFDPFYQGKQAVEALVKGTGIGLSVVREYTQAHGGSVEVVDRGERPGALLRVRLPFGRMEAAA